MAAWQASGIITQMFPLHETSALTQLRNNWVRKLFAAQPLDDIAEYFGVKVALYFAWLGHYTCALGVPAVFGVLLWAALYGRGQVAQDMGHVLFSLFNVAWASLYLEAWRRYSVELAFRWGTLSTPPELLEPPRPLYKVNHNINANIKKIINKRICVHTGSISGEHGDGPIRAQRSTGMAKTCISLFSQFPYHWTMHSTSICCNDYNTKTAGTS